MSTPKVCVHLVFALALAKVIGFGAVQAADKPGAAVEARQWEVVNVPFAVQEKPEAPFAIDATATVEGPGGKKLTVPLWLLTHAREASCPEGHKHGRAVA